MTMRAKITEQENTIAYLSSKLTDAEMEISRLTELLDEKVWPKESAIEDFENAVLRATKILAEAMRKNS